MPYSNIPELEPSPKRTRRTKKEMELARKHDQLVKGEITGKEYAKWIKTVYKN